MTADNDRTLQSYNDHVQEYVADNKQTTQGGLKTWIDRVLKLIPRDSSILELGSGYGRDADYIESLGYNIERTDAADGFVELLRKQGHPVRLLNALKDEFGAGYDMIFAQAVFLHFSSGQLEQVLRKSYDALKPAGVLAFSVKKGSGARWTDDYSWSTDTVTAERYFQFWEEPELREVVEAAGFPSVSIIQRQGSRAVWLHVTARK